MSKREVLLRSKPWVSMLKMRASPMKPVIGLPWLPAVPFWTLGWSWRVRVQ